MPKEMFQHVCTAVCNTDNYSVQKADCTGCMGIATEQKVCACIRILADGCSVDLLDDKYQLGSLTLLACFRKVTQAIITGLGPEYLRAPTVNDMRRILAENAHRGFPGLAGSIDCMLWKWDQCAAAWAGQFQNAKKGKGFQIEAACSHDLWF